jgi:hypothetical protein
VAGLGKGRYFNDIIMNESINQLVQKYPRAGHKHNKALSSYYWYVEGQAQVIGTKSAFPKVNNTEFPRCVFYMPTFHKEHWFWTRYYSIFRTMSLIYGNLIQLRLTLFRIDVSDRIISTWDSFPGLIGDKAYVCPNRKLGIECEYHFST